MPEPATTDFQALVSVVPNFRDVGGHRVSTGARVRSGIVFRSGQLSQLSGASEKAFAATSIATVFDLRTTAEMRAAPDHLPAGVSLIHLNVLADDEDAGPTQVGKLVRIAAANEDTKAIQELLGDGKAARSMTAAYQSLVTLDSAKAAYRTYFLELAAGTKPVLVHCAGGKDRTGWAAASLLLFLGVSEDTVIADYLATNEATMRDYGHLIGHYASHGGNPEVIMPVIEARAEYLQAAMTAMRSTFGSARGYLTDGLGLGQHQLTAVASRLLDA